MDAKGRPKESQGAAKERPRAPRGGQGKTNGRPGEAKEGQTENGLLGPTISSPFLVPESPSKKRSKIDKTSTKISTIVH